MSIALVHCGWMLLVTTPCAVLLSVWMGVGCCLWPISSSNNCMGIASHALMYRAPSSALAALDMMALRILDMLRMVPLSGGSLTFDEQKKWPPTQLCAEGSLR